MAPSLCCEALYGYPSVEQCPSFVPAIAAMLGHVNCLSESIRRGCPVSEDVAFLAARKGRRTCLVVLKQEAGILFDWTTVCAAVESGDVVCLQYLHQQGCCPLVHEEYAVRAAKGGHLACLSYLLHAGCPADRHACAAAAEKGNLDCLYLLHLFGVPWDELTCVAAAAGGHLGCLCFAKEKGCPWDVSTTAMAAQGGWLPCLTYAHEGGCPWDEFTCLNASATHNEACLRYAYERGCPWEEDAERKAAWMRRFARTLLSVWRRAYVARTVCMYWMGEAVATACREGGRAREEDVRAYARLMGE